MAARAGGTFILTAVASLLALALGLGVGPWFVAKEEEREHRGVRELDALARRAQDAPNGEVEIRLYQTEVCAYFATRCVATDLGEYVDGQVGAAGLAMLGIGILFAVVVGLTVNRRIAGRQTPRGIAIGAMAIGAIAVVGAAVVVFALRPGPMGFNIVTYMSGGGLLAPGWPTDETIVLTAAPTIGWGPVVTVIGIGLGMVTIWRTRAVVVVAVVGAGREVVGRSEPVRGGQGAETDPFRAPPRPPVIAVVREERAVVVPRAAGAGEGDELGPRVLR